MNKKEKIYVAAAGAMLGISIYAFSELCYNLGKSVAYREVCKELANVAKQTVAEEAAKA